MQGHPVFSEDMKLFTNASGCVFGHLWMFPPCILPWDGLNINAKEIFAIWIAVATWEEFLRNKQIIMFSENKNTVKMWYQGCT